MTAFGAIQAALSYLKVPCVPGTYEGSEQTYITYNYALIRGADFGDNAPACDVADVQIHYFTPSRDPKTHKQTNYNGIRKEIRNALFAGGFTYPTVEVIEERDEAIALWHLVFECQYEE